MGKTLRFGCFVVVAWTAVTAAVSAAEVDRTFDALGQKAAAAAQAPVAARLQLAQDLIQAMRRAPICQRCEFTALQGLTAEQKSQAQELAARLGKALKLDAATDSAWKTLVGGTPKGAQIDVDVLVFYVLHDAYDDQIRTLQDVTNRVTARNEKSRQIRENVDSLHDQLRGATDQRQKSRIEDSIKNLETALETIGEDAQLANVDLQNALQKVQQILQAMSKIAKQLHDTALAIIRNLK